MLGSSSRVLRVALGITLASAPLASAGVVADDVGLSRPGSQDFVDEGFVPVSLERLPDIDGDVLFLWGNDDYGDALLERAMQNPLWASLEVVRNDAAHTVDGDVWQGASYFAAHRGAR